MNCNDLIRKYIHLFEPEEIRLDETKSCMAWGIECDGGWYELLDNMMAKIDSLHVDGFVFEQIKEKFGTLRVYSYGSTPEIDKIIDEAERLSETTCELCGKPGKIRGSRWITVRCDECEEKR